MRRWTIRPVSAALALALVVLGLSSADVRADQLAGPSSRIYLPVTTGRSVFVPQPTGLYVATDDRVATARWDFDPEEPMAPAPQGVAGYLVIWGPADNPAANKALTEQRFIQLQPLENGKPYVAQVQAVDSYGNTSRPTVSAPFTSSATRVDRLRAQMNGFFDDFNLPEGPPDERNWNTTYLLCNEPTANSFFINKQFHVHNTVRSESCDRGHSTNRARARIDFSDNGTRTIVFDLDGVQRRQTWYLHLVPGRHDIIPLDVDNSEMPNMVGALRIRQSGQMVTIGQVQPNGEVIDVANTDWEPYPPLDWAGVPLVPNVRRQWEIKVSRTSVEVRVDGVLVLSTPPGAIRLTENSYEVNWSLFTYDITKGNQPIALMHWDNFGFDAPAGKGRSTVTHNYRLVNSGTDLVTAIRETGSAAPSVALTIPDSIQGATAQRLLFVAQPPFPQAAEWRAGDRVLINGRAFPIAQPLSRTSPALPFDLTLSSILPYTYEIVVPAGVFRQGANTISFDTHRSWFHSLHAEFDFPIGAAPAYTQPAQAAAGVAAMPIWAIGHQAAITRIGTTDLELWRDDLNNPGRFQPTVRGSIPIEVFISGDQVHQGTGGNPGVRVVELLVDQRVVASVRTDAQVAAPSVSHTFQLDTRWLTDGTHQVAVRSYTPGCVPSIPGYGNGNGESGRYYPIHINVRNGTAPTMPAPPTVPATCAASASTGRSLTSELEAGLFGVCMVP